MPRVFTSENQRTGEIGEHLAARYLLGKGYKIIERNYTKKWGEIDIIAAKGSITHFIEVKSKSQSKAFEGKDIYRPEDNMHPWKVKRLIRTIQTYILENNIEGEWQFDLVVIHTNLSSKEACVKMLENIIL